MFVIGIDCATEDSRTGLALAEWTKERTVLQEAILCSRNQTATATVGEWLGPLDQALLAIDAPLGWPAPLGQGLTTHRAGERLSGTPNALFRRNTDQFIQKELGKTPLDVGADRIARTAHAALEFLSDLRVRAKREIPLAWTSTPSGIAAVEVYPAATLAAYRFPSKSYKKPSQMATRLKVISSLGTLIDLGSHERLLQVSADVLDAVVCVLAGIDFLEGRALPPPDFDLATREGWIWAAGRREA